VKTPPWPSSKNAHAPVLRVVLCAHLLHTAASQQQPGDGMSRRQAEFVESAKAELAPIRIEVDVVDRPRPAVRFGLEDEPHLNGAATLYRQRGAQLHDRADGPRGSGLQ